LFDGPLSELCMTTSPTIKDDTVTKREIFLK
jgi:hypothetical protein